MFTKTRKQLNAMVWCLAAPTVRGYLAGKRAVLIPRGHVPQLVPVSALSDQEAMRLASSRLMASRLKQWRAMGLTRALTWPSVPWAVVHGDGEPPKVGHQLSGELRAIVAATDTVPFGHALGWATAEALRLNALYPSGPRVTSPLAPT
jgi:hypothetical protein